MGITADNDDNAVMTLESIGRRLGCLVSGGLVDYVRAGKLFLEAFSTGRIGKVSLERPGITAVDALNEPAAEPES